MDTVERHTRGHETQWWRAVIRVCLLRRRGGPHWRAGATHGRPGAVAMGQQVVATACGEDEQAQSQCNRLHS